MDITHIISSFMHTHIPDTGGWTWGDLAWMGALTLLGWTSEFVKFMAAKNGTLT